MLKIQTTGEAASATNRPTGRDRPGRRAELQGPRGAGPASPSRSPGAPRAPRPQPREPRLHRRAASGRRSEAGVGPAPRFRGLSRRYCAAGRDSRPLGTGGRRCAGEGDRAGSPHQAPWRSAAVAPPHSGPGCRSLDNWIRGSETPAASSEAKQLTEGAGPRVLPLGVRRRLGPRPRAPALQASSLGALVRPGKPSAGERPSRLAAPSVHPFWVGDTSLL